MRSGRVDGCGDVVPREVSEADWDDQCREDATAAGNSGRQGLRAGRGYRPGYDARYPEFGKRER